MVSPPIGNVTFKSTTDLKIYTATGVVAAAPICVDCTICGSKTPPTYWK